MGCKMVQALVLEELKALIGQLDPATKATMKSSLYRISRNAAVSPAPCIAYVVLLQVAVPQGILHIKWPGQRHGAAELLTCCEAKPSCKQPYSPTSYWSVERF